MARPIRLLLSEEDSERLREILAGLPPPQAAMLRRVLLGVSVLLIVGLIALAVWRWDEVRSVLGHVWSWLEARWRWLSSGGGPR